MWGIGHKLWAEIELTSRLVKPVRNTDEIFPSFLGGKVYLPKPDEISSHKNHSILKPEDIK